MEKQHNRGQDGAGFASIKLNMNPGQRYISRVRSVAQQPIQDIFAQINERINKVLEENPQLKDDVSNQKQMTANPGDLVLFNGNCWHGASPNNSDDQRAVLLIEFPIVS